ncbi:hypothetical protein Lal_00010981 [Lupinus albus]|nr:hypothetical protein Lal_00010981 [Lupinus albus]
MYSLDIIDFCIQIIIIGNGEKHSMGTMTNAHFGDIIALTSAVYVSAVVYVSVMGFSPGRERLTWEGEILGYTGGFSPERGLVRLSESGLA